jgi:hypothetical protein
LQSFDFSDATVETGSSVIGADTSAHCQTELLCRLAGYGGGHQTAPVTDASVQDRQPFGNPQAASLFQARGLPTNAYYSENVSAINVNDTTTRWTVSVSRETDIAVRTVLAQRGMKKGDLSKFIENAVRWRVFDQARDKFADIPPAPAWTPPTQPHNPVWLVIDTNILVSALLAARRCRCIWLRSGARAASIC